ncbi:MAG: thioredoxin-dependent thiol peroxidase [Marinosulfonomonas sp.]|nr:thioredoxin-dependent thiol peroxidase [Marinosulfonomonas sp.]
MLKNGQIAPDFTLPRDGGSLVTLSDLRGQAVVLFFYPKDNTPGCTTESIAFTAMKAEFEAANTTILGVSKDSVASHDKFRTKHDLGVALISDVDGDLCERYGVWGEKNNYGRKYMGITRTTVLIDDQGKIAQIWNKVRVKGHVEDVLAAAQAL